MRPILTLVSLLFVLFGCKMDRSLYEERASRAEHGKGEIVIGAVAPWGAQALSMQKGIELAQDEINSAGGVLGRKIRIIWRDDHGSVDEAKIIAQEFAQNLDMIAVIGHYYSYLSTSVSVIYEFSGLIMLTPSSTVPSLTRRASSLVFRNIPTDSEFGKHLADYAHKKGYRRIIIYYVRNEYGLELSGAFEKKALGKKMTIVDRESYDPAGEWHQLRKVLEAWKNYYNFDAIFLAGHLPQVANIIALARETGISEPIIGGDGFDGAQLLEIAGNAAQGVVFATAFHPDDDDTESQRFSRLYEKRYGIRPESGAAQGYDALKVLAHAIAKAGSASPRKVAHALRSTKDWRGATGVHNFDENGDVVGKEIDMVTVQNGRFEFLK